MQSRFERGIWWVKRDFRVADNDALLEAISSCRHITVLFIIEPSLCRATETSIFHYRAWQQASNDLERRVHALGGHFSVIVGESVDVFQTLWQHCAFDALYSHEETGSHITFSRDLAVEKWCAQHGVHWHQATQNGVIRGLKDRGKRQPVIKKRLMDTTPQAAPVRIDGDARQVPLDAAVTEWPSFEEVSDKPVCLRIQTEHTQQVSETQAELDLHSFLFERGLRYSGGISSPNSAFTAGSRLSAHLAWGTISLRRVFHETWQRDRELAQSVASHKQEAYDLIAEGLAPQHQYSTTQAARWRKSLKAFQSRLHWHDHFIQRLESAPEMEFESINPAYSQLRYQDNHQLLQAWHSGHTGIPLVDACMRCLGATGFLNFRMRAMIVSVACFGLRQSWRSIQYPLAQLFLDYEPGIHFSQIQMQAGIVGINTLRVYSPHKQLLDQDPQLTFVKRWIPELSEFDALEIADYPNRGLGDYPAPIVDLASNTRDIRDQVYAIRKSQDGRTASAHVLEKHGSRLPGNDRTKKRSASTKKAKPINVAQTSFDFGEDN